MIAPVETDHDFLGHRWRRRVSGPLFALACFLATLTGILVLSVLLGSIITTALGQQPGRPWYHVVQNSRDLLTFLWSLTRKTQGLDAIDSGFKTGIISSLWLLGMTALFAIPVGVGAGIYMEEYAPPGRFKNIIQINIANLAGVPSIVYGILGLALFVRAFGYNPLAMGYSLWAGSLTLGVLSLPVIVIATQEALRTVPISLRRAALALGANRWQVIRDHVVPSAMPGILTGVILALSRAIGETAPVLMVSKASSLLRPPTSPSDTFVALPVEIYNYAREPLGTGFEQVVAGGIMLLLILLLTMNASAIFIRQRFSRNLRA